jgi:hypothetical protein
MKKSRFGVTNLTLQPTPISPSVKKMVRGIQRLLLAVISKNNKIHFLLETHLMTFCVAPNVAYKSRTTIQLLKDSTRDINSYAVPEADLTDENFDTCLGVDRSNASTIIRIELDQRYDISGVKIRFNDRDVYTDVEIRVTDTENETANEETCEVIEWDRRVRGMIVNCQKILRGNVIKIYDRLREGTFSICDISAYQQPGNTQTQYRSIGQHVVGLVWDFAS